MDPPAPFHPTATRRLRTPTNVVRVGVGVLIQAPPSTAAAAATTTGTNNNKNKNRKSHHRVAVTNTNTTTAATTTASSVRVYAGFRKGNNHGSGELALPGGHLELSETWESCAVREVYEETGLEITNVRFCHVTNDIMMDEDDKHYVTIFMMAEQVNPAVRVQNLEPDKCEGWDTYSFEDLKAIADEQMNAKSRSKASVIRERVDPDEGGLQDGNSSSPSFHPRLFTPLLHLVQEQPKTMLDFFYPSKAKVDPS